MLFSFSKGSRFPNNKENSYLCFHIDAIDFIIFLPTSKKEVLALVMELSMILLKSNIFVYSRLPTTPPPGAYEKSTLFEEAKIKNKGFCFGSGRGDMEVTGLNPRNSNPGPGTYDHSSGRKKIAYSLRKKIVFHEKEKLGIPGPGKCTIFFTILDETYTTFK